MGGHTSESKTESRFNLGMQASILSASDDCLLSLSEHSAANIYICTLDPPESVQ